MARNSELIERVKSRRAPKAAKEPPGLKARIDTLTSLIGLVTKLALFVGFLGLTAYLGAAQHVVSGFNLTDVFLLAAIAAALGFFGLLVAMLGAAALYQPVFSFVLSVAYGKVPQNYREEYWRRSKVFWLALLAFLVLVPLSALAIALLSQFLWDGALNHLMVAWVVASASVAWFVAGSWVRAHGLLREAVSMRWDRADEFAERLMGALLLLMSGVLFFLLPALFSSIGIAACIALCGLLFVAGLQLQFVRGPAVGAEWAGFGRILIGIALVLSVFIATSQPIFKGERGVVKALQAVSLNVPHATISVSAANLQRLERTAAQHGLPLQVCRYADGTATLTDVRVLWHSLGSAGLVELWPEPSDPAAYANGERGRFQTAVYEQWFHVLGLRGVRVPLDNTGLTVSTGSNLRCLELSGLLFDSNAATLGDSFQEDLHKQLSALQQSLRQEQSPDGKTALTLVRLEVVGHADPRRRQKGTNEDLAKQRALAVKAALADWIATHAKEWQAVVISPHSEGAREPARKCDASGPQEEEACNAFNRRVVLKAYTAPAPAGHPPGA